MVARVATRLKHYNHSQAVLPHYHTILSPLLYVKNSIHTYIYQALHAYSLSLSAVIERRTYVCYIHAPGSLICKYVYIYLCIMHIHIYESVFYMSIQLWPFCMCVQYLRGLWMAPAQKIVSTPWHCALRDVLRQVRDVLEPLLHSIYDVYLYIYIDILCIDMCV